MRKRNPTPKIRKDISYKAKGVAKRKKKTAVKRPRAPKTRNENTMTEGAFWQWIRHCLRKQSIYWKPIQAVKKKRSRPYTGPDKRRKYEYQCAVCGEWFPSQKVSVHHKVPCGQLNKPEDLPGFVERLFCEREGLELLCDGCHNKEHELLKKEAA